MVATAYNMRYGSANTDDVAFGTAAAAGAQKALDQPVWMWQDMFNAYLPRLLSVIKDIPIPRYGVFELEVIAR